MGGKAQVNVETVNENIFNTILKFQKFCGTQANNQFSFSVGVLKTGGKKITIGAEDASKAATWKQSAVAEIVDCNQKTDIESAMKAELANAIASDATAEGSPLGEVNIYSEALNDTSTINRTVMNFDMSDLMTCLAEATSSINLNMGNVDTEGGEFILNQNIDQSSRATIMKCIQETNLAQTLSTSITNDITATAKKANIFSSLGNIIASIVILALIAGGIGLVYYMYTKKKKDSQSDGSGEESLVSEGESMSPSLVSEGESMTSSLFSEGAILKNPSLASEESVMSDEGSYYSTKDPLPLDTDPTVRARFTLDRIRKHMKDQEELKKNL